MAGKAQLQEMKRGGRKISVLTCYDYPTALWEEEAGVDVVFVGDSVGTNVLGYASETEVTMEDMAHHLKAVRRGVREAYLLADLPFGSADTPGDAVENGRGLVSLGADGVKLEGFKPEAVRALSGEGLDVWGHLGLTPQFHRERALQAKTAESAAELVSRSLELEGAGADFLVLEAVPEEVAAAVTRRLSIPTIGIAAGRCTDGQVIVVSDLLGAADLELRHVDRLADSKADGVRAIRAFVEGVREGSFPAERHVRHMSGGELEKFEAGGPQAGGN
jgi:3-methyl-2-oxobutanoate hydroxymethyltransferase